MTSIVPPTPGPKPVVSPIATPTPGAQPTIAPIEPIRPNAQWFKLPYRNFNEWNRNALPLPVTGNRVIPYIHIMDYYVALGQTIRNTRQNLADFVYIAGWELDLDTFVDPPSANSRQTLRDVLAAAAKQGVEVRVLLTDQPKENELPNRGAAQDVAKLGGGGIVDPFHKLVGSQHQKVVIIRNAEGIMAFCGGCDIAKARLGREGLLASQKPVDSVQASAPWHDVQVRIQGPATADIWNTFVQRFKEVAATYVSFYPVTDIAKNPISGIAAYGKMVLREPDFAASKSDQSGIDVQVVRTYPNLQKKNLGDELIVFPRQAGYRFAPNGEMGIYELLNQALSQTARTIYLEDQYLTNSVSMGNHPPITEILRKAIEKQTFQKMVIAVAGTGTVQTEVCQAGSRRAEFMQQLGPIASQKVAVYVYKADPNSPYWFHSKTWIFDDQFAVISSANCNRRGYSHDSEIGVGVADLTRGSEQMNFAQRLRMDLWLKHLNAIPQGANASQYRKLTDNDVRDFVTASGLWDKAPLLQRVDFTQNPEPDIPGYQKIVKAYPRVAKIYATIQSRDLDWTFIDPNGS